MTEKQKLKKEEKLLFGVAPNSETDDLLLAVTPQCWEYMKDGKTHTLDLTPIGVPVRLIVFGCENHAAAIKVIEEHNKRLGLGTLHLPRKDFSIKPKGERDG